MKRQAEKQIISAITSRPRIPPESGSSSQSTIFSERKRAWFQKRQELSALTAGSPDLFVCFLSTVSLLRRHCSETDEVDSETKAWTKTALKSRSNKNPRTGNWACNLIMPSTATATVTASSSPSSSPTKTF
ncbi:hypothetical protein BGX26_009776 [Mortierella sp. AD094]|nr:hypothetical protein BGX26_009776 [Mortierella sp. AD094]